MIRVKTKENFSKVEKYLNRIKDSSRVRSILDKYGQRGVDLLRSATPIDSGDTANSWFYEITEGHGRYSIEFGNSNINAGVNIAIIIQYGHGTRNGGYVQGRDYINPVIKQAFDEMRNELVKEVGRL